MDDITRGPRIFDWVLSFLSFFKFRSRCVDQSANEVRATNACTARLRQTSLDVIIARLQRVHSRREISRWSDWEIRLRCNILLRKTQTHEHALLLPRLHSCASSPATHTKNRSVQHEKTNNSFNLRPALPFFFCFAFFSSTIRWKSVHDARSMRFMYTAVTSTRSSTLNTMYDGRNSVLRAHLDPLPSASPPPFQVPASLGHVATTSAIENTFTEQ